MISGYLITKSWQRDANLPRYLLRRSLRIFPLLRRLSYFLSLLLEL